MRDGARTALRQKIANVLFVVSSIEDGPCELDGAADEITVSFPWGSLLRGIVRAQSSVLLPLAGLAKSGAVVRILLSVEDRDSRTGLMADEMRSLHEKAAAYVSAGFVIERSAIATAAEIARRASSWAKRLGPARTVHAITLRRLSTHGQTR